jgi:hypothetical protein
MKRERIETIDVDKSGDVTFYFENTKGPFNAREYIPGSTTWEDLKRIESAIHWFNSISDAEHGRSVTLRE